jgi:tRNA modification GTPase
MSRFRNDQQTICALATPPGVGGISVIRVSGMQVRECVAKLAPFLPQSPESHKIYYGHLKSVGGVDLDEVLLSYFAEGRSFTGEETIEISSHGSPLIATRVLSELVVAGCRVADPGEFTYRAFMHGNVDLVQAESVLELIESETELARAHALRQLKGSLSNTLREMEQELTHCLAHLEANLDFAQEDIEFANPIEISHRLDRVFDKAKDLLSTHQTGKIIRQGYQVAIVGPPNAGKSSLLNYLAQEDVAIVTHIPGTTRDVLSADIKMGHHAVRFFDTAGLRASTDEVEQIGIERSFKTAKDADLVVFLDSVDDPMPTPEWLQGRTFLRLRNKADLLTESRPAESGILYVSAKTGIGVPDLCADIAGRVQAISGDSNGVTINARHFRLLNECLDGLARARTLQSENASPEFVLAEAQFSLECLMEVSGKRFDDEVLDEVFRQFCLGK